MKLNLTSQPIDKIPTEIVVLTHYQDDVPFKSELGLLDWRINGRLSRFIQDKHYVGKAKELLLMPSEKRLNAPEVMILGLGLKEGFQQDHIGQVIDFMLQTLDNKKHTQICCSLHQMIPSEFEWRNAVRLLVSKLSDHKTIKETTLWEPVDFIRDAKKRQLDFGPGVQVEFH